MRIHSGPSKAGVLVQVLVVVIIVGLLAGFILFSIKGHRRPVIRTKVYADISDLMIALTEYYNDFGVYPPGGTDLNDNGNLDDPGDDYGSGHLPADPAHPKITDLQLRALCMKIPAENNTRTVGPYFAASRAQVDRNGRMVDAWGNPFRYLSDGRRKTFDPKTGLRLPGRVVDKGPVIWSVGRDGKQDPLNNNLDDNNDGKVDDPGELVDDICSWN